MAGPATLYLIDGHAQFFRAYHAIRTSMTSPVTHEPTNMTYGFVAMLLKVMREYRPEYLAVVIDVSGDRQSFRSQIYPEYKANRSPAPEDFGPQVDRCLGILEAMHVPVVGVEGVEADDVIATLVERVRREHSDVRIRVVSRDKDLTQLLDDSVELFDVHTDESVTPAEIFKTEGVEPRHVVDILSLMGDTVDNVPGVPGIGPKTAAKLVLEYGSLDGVLEHLDEIKGKRRENIEQARDVLVVSRQLVRLKSDVDVEFDLDRARCDPARLRVEAILPIFRDLGFNMHERMLRELTKEPGAAQESSADGVAAQGRAAPKRADRAGAGMFEESLFAEASTALEPQRPPPDGVYRAILNASDLDALVAQVRAAGAIAIDTETDSIHPMAANLCGVSIATREREGSYIPIRSPEPQSHLDLPLAIARLRGILEDDCIAKIGHNLKYDLNVLRRHGVRVRGPLFDTMIASYVIDATRSSHKLDVLALSMLRHESIPLHELIGTGRSQRRFDEVPLDQAVPYASEDADIALRLRDALAPQLKETGLDRLFAEVEMPLVEVLAEIEFNGIRVDRAELERQRISLAVRIDRLRAEILEAAPHPFNPDSPKQLRALLFNRPDQDPPGLGLAPLKRTKTGASTDQEVLESLAEDSRIDSPVPRLILEHRLLTKLVSTYLVALAEAIDPSTGRVHASFNQTVAATGRLSSSDPNLQAIPIRSDVGREIRRAFVADPGNVLIAADYSQIELRLLAHLARDPALITAFRQGADIHRAVAAEVFGVDQADVTSEQRATAKMVNFGIIYGVTAYGLARRLGKGVSKADAARVIADYKARFARIQPFLDECVRSAEERGWVETILGRRRRIPQVGSRNPQQRALGERVAINTVVQGSAADLIKVAMIDLHRALPGRHSRARMLLQIHDELVFEAPEEEGEAVQAFVVERMEQAMALDVPLVVNAARSTSWIDA